MKLVLEANVSPESRYVVKDVEEYISLSFHYTASKNGVRTLIYPKPHGSILLAIEIIVQDTEEYEQYGKSVSLWKIL